MVSHSFQKQRFLNQSTVSVKLSAKIVRKLPLIFIKIQVWHHQSQVSTVITKPCPSHSSTSVTTCCLPSSPTDRCYEASKIQQVYHSSSPLGACVKICELVEAAVYYHLQWVFMPAGLLAMQYM